MKFKKLTIHNLASIAYASLDFEQAPLADNPIFLICGDTGSGKSTLLDAISLALYDASPRFKSSSADKFKLEGVFGEVTNNDTTQILRKNASEGLSELVFEGNDGKTYTAAWKVRIRKKRGNPEVEIMREWALAYVEESREITLDKIEDIKARISDAVGLTYEQFCRTSLLAQGEFTKFLKSNDNDKSAILEKLTDTAQFARVGAGIYSKMTAKRAALDDLQKVMALTKVMTEDETAAKRTERANLSRQLETQTGQVEAAQKKYDWLNRKEQAEGDIKRTTALFAQKRNDFAVLLGGVEALKNFIAERDREIAALEAGLTQTDARAMEERREMCRTAQTLLEQWTERWVAVGRTEVQAAKIEKELGELQRGAAALTEALQQAETAYKQAQAVLEATQKGVDDAAKAVRARAKVGEDCPVCGHKIEKILTDEFFEKLYAPAKQKYDEAEKAYKKADNEHKAMQVNVKAKSDNLAFVKKKREEQKNEAAQLYARLVKLFGREIAVEDVAQEIDRLQEEQKKISSQLEVLKNLEKQRLQKEKCVAAYHDAVPLVEALAKQFGEAVSAAAVAVVKDLNPKLGLLQGEVAALTDRRKQAEKERDAMAVNLAGLQPDETKESLKAFLVQAQKNIAECNRLIGALDLLLKQDEANRKAQLKNAECLAALQTEYEKWERLNKLFGDATGSKFRKMVLNYIMDELLSYANEHLKTLSDRYRLESSFGSFAVLVRDLHDGGSLRPASSLSGGESFLVSLALALGLSSFSSSRITTDILFIDEGFGTLSGNALEPAIAALERLHRAGGRRVGIISHVPALRERIRTQIRVERTDPTCSHVSVTM